MSRSIKTIMTKLLEKFIGKIEKLPELEQSLLVNRLLTELEQDLIPQESACLDDVINLVDQWLAEDSQYDEEVYPELEHLLLKNSVSISSKFIK
jgi:hypothetical protein